MGQKQNVEGATELSRITREQDRKVGSNDRSEIPDRGGEGRDGTSRRSKYKIIQNCTVCKCCSSVFDVR